jgi:hypothetical protein
MPQDRWLRTPCCGNVLWAYDLRHLDLLEEYVGASVHDAGAVAGVDQECRQPE